MLKKRNASVHIYNENEAEEILSLIQNNFISEFTVLESVLRNKIADIDEIN